MLSAYFAPIFKALAYYVSNAGSASHLAVKTPLLNITLADFFVYSFYHQLVSQSATHFSFDKFFLNANAKIGCLRHLQRQKCASTGEVWCCFVVHYFFFFFIFSFSKIFYFFIFFIYLSFFSFFHIKKLLHWSTRAQTATRFKIHYFVQAFAELLAGEIWPSVCVTAFWINMLYQMTLDLDILQSVLICHLHPAQTLGAGFPRSVI